MNITQGHSMTITLVFSAPKLLALDATAEAVVATFQWPGSGNISTVTVKRIAAWVGSSYVRTETGQGAVLDKRVILSKSFLHYDYETGGIKSYVAAIKGLKLPPLTQQTGIVVGGLYKIDSIDELVTVISCSPRVRRSKSRDGAFYRVSLLANGSILKLKVGTLTFEDRGWIIVDDDRGNSKRLGRRSLCGASLKAL